MNNKIPTIPNFPELENKWLKKWQEKSIIKKYLKKNANSKKRFSFIDGPITANNPMGVHHGWGRTYKDLWQKFHNLLGDKLRFQNGFDCQGLWVEVEVEKELKLKNKKDIENLVQGDKKASIAKFVNLCKERVYKYSAIQTEQSKRLGYFMDWDNSYFTMSDDNNYMIWHFLKVCHDKGWIYKGRESVPWCPRCETAISQHEMLTEDYKQTTHESIYLKLPILNRNKEFLLVWTTTPWTIPANIAVAVDTKLDYSLVESTSGDRYYVAKDTIERIFGKNYKQIVKTIKGEKLVNLKYKGPFDNLEAVKKVAKQNPDKFHIVIPTDEQILPINTNEGTGLVHTAVSAGTEDFRLGKKYGLPMIPVIADNADYLPGLGFLTGKNAKTDPRIILDYLLQEDKKPGISWVFKIENYTHRYPACWRCKTELVWKVEDEWYIAMDKPDPTDEKKRTFRKQMIDVAKSIKWLPSFGLNRELDWLNNMHDWLISKKNRYWGLALPIYECKKCGEFQVVGSKQELQKLAVEGWDKFANHTPHKPWVDEVKISCQNCGEKVARINDVGNPWLDAGIVPFSTLVDPKTKKVSYLTDKKYWLQWFPADFITESFPGQFKNWFYALIAMSTVLEKTAPFKTVLGFGTLLGEDGRPMHKSWGNAIEFNEGANKMGVDVMRWMYCRHDPSKNLLFGYKKAEEVKRLFHIPLWNIVKFFLTYKELDNWGAKEKTQLDVEKLQLLDRWILSRFTQTLIKVRASLEKYDPESATEAIHSFVSDLSLWYIRLSRNRVWNNSNNNKDKNHLYTILELVLTRLSIVLSIFLPFFSEEIYQLVSGAKESVHLETWPETNKNWYNQTLNDAVAFVRSLAELAHAKRKEAKIKVRQPLKKATYQIPKDTYKTLITWKDEFASMLSQELNIKEVVFKQSLIKEPSLELDTVLTPQLKTEGRVRDLIRDIQQKRKLAGCGIDEKVKIIIPNIPKEFIEIVKQKVLAHTIELNDKNQIKIIRD